MDGPIGTQKVEFVWSSLSCLRCEGQVFREMFSPSTGGQLHSDTPTFSYSHHDDLQSTSDGENQTPIYPTQVPSLRPVHFPPERNINHASRRQCHRTPPAKRDTTARDVRGPRREGLFRVEGHA